jgi:hypothetical protein
MRTRLAAALLALYPEAWLQRYGEEMHALIEDDPPGLRGNLSLLTGAAGAHLRPRGRWHEGIPAAASMRLSVGGLFACWIAVSLAGSAFAKEAEHMDRFEHLHPLMSAARALITAGAAIGAAAVALGGLPLVYQAVARAARDRDRRLAWLLAAPVLAVGTLVALAALLTHVAPARGGGFPAPFVLVILVPLTLSVVACAFVAAAAPKAVMRRARPPAALLRLASLAGQGLAVATLLVTGGLLLYVAELWRVPAAGTAPSGPFGANTRITLCLALAVAIPACLGALVAATRARRAAFAG